MKTTKLANIENDEINIGVDIGKNTLDICVYELDLHWQESNTEIGIRR